MNFINLATSRLGPALSTTICRTLSRRQTQQLTEPIALSLANRQHPMIATLHSNLAVVLGLEAGDPQVDRAVAQLLRNMLDSYSDLFRLVAREQDPAAIVDFSAVARQALLAHSKKRRGLVLVGVHMCSFDLSLLAAAGFFPVVQGLSKANPDGSAPVMNDLRSGYGLQITPLSTESLRQAITTLRHGGVVAVAADIPLEEGEELFFFGRKARLGVGHARLALATGADLVVAVSHQVGDGRYRIEAAPVPRPAGSGGRKQDALHLAQAALMKIESYIHKWPDQWFMPQPVWPECSQMGMI